LEAKEGVKRKLVKERGDRWSLVATRVSADVAQVRKDKERSREERN
jgi:hypothetical protein